MLPSKFGVNWPFGSVEETQNRFSRWPPMPSWISDRNDFDPKLPSFELDLEITKINILSKIHDDCLNKSPLCFLASLESISLSVQEKKSKIDFQDGCHGGHLGFLIGMILAIFDL